MQSKIENILAKTPLLKARQIAKKIGVTRKVVNVVLYKHPDKFVKNEENRWILKIEADLKIEFASKTWVNCGTFEGALNKAGCPMSSTCHSVTFVFPPGCFILLEASARLLALCNQLTMNGKKVFLDFTNNGQVSTFLDRNGFLEHLDKKVTTIPKRPKFSKAKRYKGNSDRLFEVRRINPDDPDEKIPEQLKNYFVECAGEEYSVAAFTIFAELFSNVCEHSKTPIPGFAALQAYGGYNPHIQTVVSDSGVGILGTLKPILKRRYPELARKYDLSDPRSGLALIKNAFEKGQITSRPKREGGGGSGLKISQKYAKKFNAIISIRQETSELILSYRNGIASSARSKVNLSRIMGTHVCFDFSLA